MLSKRIIVPVDFTDASENAIKQAVIIARKAGTSIWLVHVKDAKSYNDRLSELSVTEDNLDALAKNVKDEGVDCRYSILKGSIFDELPQFANNGEFSLMVIGTHGIKGLKQKLLGADILKIVRKISIPGIIVQENCICRNFNPIVFPVGGHKNFIQLIEATAALATLFNSEVHLYSVIRRGVEESENLRANIALAKKIFGERNIVFKRVKEESTIISVGYAKQTLDYAERIGAGLIAIMSVKSEEFYYFAQSDKETMINNEYNIPVFCTSGLENA